ncbi:MAG: murein biosynthesis integral membrane protein MurJ [Actinobacteria bacterium]|nr:MAG: murein biosynthesis integral membrane protein MurJ [Actinomycetota bacterium]
MLQRAERAAGPTPDPRRGAPLPIRYNRGASSPRARARTPAVRPRSAAISKPSVARSTATMSVATTLSRVTGFVRMWATAYALGATAMASAYSVANNVPNMIYELVVGGIISSLFIPTFMEIRSNEGEQRAWRFASHLFNLAVLGLGAIAVVGILFPEPFIWTQTFRMGSAEAGSVRPIASAFFAIFAIKIMLYGAGSVVSGLLNSDRRYLWVALGPVFNNVVVIAALFVYAAVVGDNERLAFYILAGGTTAGVAVMYLVQLPSLLKSGWRYEFGVDLKDPGIRRMAKLALPTIVYVATNMVAVSVRNSSAFAVSPEGPARLMYAWTFYQLPYGILAVSLTTALFTELSDAAGRQDWGAFRRDVARGLRSTAVLILPMAATMIALATPLVRLYQVGEFDAASVGPVASALRWWSVALVFYSATMFLLRTFYSLKDTKTPMTVNLVLTGVQIGLYFLLTTGAAGWAGLGLDGIPIADAVFFALSMVALAAILRRRVGDYELPDVGLTFGKVAVAAAAGAVAAWGAARLLAPLAGGVSGALLQTAGGGVAGLAVTYGIAAALRVHELASAAALLRRKLVPSRAQRAPDMDPEEPDA